MSRDFLKYIDLISLHIFYVLAFFLLFFIIFENVKPFGGFLEYTQGKGLSTLLPLDRYSMSDSIIEVVGEALYFDSKVPKSFEYARVTVEYKNYKEDQKLLIGYRNSKDYSYYKKPLDWFDVPLSDRSGLDLYLYQKEKNYSSIEEFLAAPPTDEIIATAEYNKTFLTSYLNHFGEYTPRTEDTIIDIPLRGSYIAYVFLKNEPFSMNLYKQDLNWYEGADTMKVTVSKDRDVVYTVDVTDDGIDFENRKSQNPQLVTIKSLADEIPEQGVYKIEVKASKDVITRRIETNLDQIVFHQSIYPISNYETYSQLGLPTRSNSIFTNSMYLRFLIHHDSAIQTADISGVPYYLEYKNNEHETQLSGNVEKVNLPSSNAELYGDGFFAFAAENFFEPTSLHTLPLEESTNLDYIDYVISDSLPAEKSSNWYVSQQYYKLEDAYIKNSKLSWGIFAPNIDKNYPDVYIKSIKIEYYKNPIL